MHLIDIHCHILPKVDDGPRTIKEATALLELMREQGVQVAIATPHYRPHMFETSMEEIVRHYQGMKRIARTKGIRLLLGCEHYRNTHMVELIDSKARPTLYGSSYVLAEFSSDDVFQTIRNYIHSLRTHGYKPIIAHVERYECCRNIQNIEELVKMGAYIQINAESILGDRGMSLKQYCKKLIKKDLVDFIASDNHNCKSRKPNLGTCASYIEKKYGTDYAHRIFVDNPMNIIKDRRTS